ncbi:uncharacterized protein DS421_6g189900 [Arachis hypogaea]|nr:uncharacterized protein DS421_6g189900 [Arachis hypogaea]
MSSTFCSKFSEMFLPKCCTLIYCKLFLKVLSSSGSRLKRGSLSLFLVINKKRRNQGQKRMGALCSRTEDSL